MVTQAYADSLTDFLQQTTIRGNLRLYNFSRDYSNTDLSNQNAFSIGGQISLLTAPLLPGLQLGGTFYTAQPLGLNSDDVRQVDNTLPGFPVNVLGQAYLQYQTKAFLIRAGNQLIDTPWLNAADSRMIPATYQGLYSVFTPWNNWTFTALRTIRFKGRSENNFTRTNLYNSSNIGGSSIVAFGNTATNGALAFGADYKRDDLNVKTWFYQFYDLANLAYGDIKYSLPLHNSWQPFMGIQVLREWGEGNNLLAPYTGGKSNADIVGAVAGINLADFNFTLGYNFIPTDKNAFKQGNILSPYTSGYAVDPLYTTSMIAGLVEKAPGQAVKLSSTYALLDKKLLLALSYAKYYTAPLLADTDEINFDTTYNFSGRFQGFSVRNRLGILNGNTSTGRFIYNRVMLQYNF